MFKNSKKYNQFDNYLFEGVDPDIINYYNCKYNNDTVLLSLKHDRLILQDSSGDVLKEILYKQIPMWKRNAKYIKIFVGKDDSFILKGDGVKISDTLNRRCQDLFMSRNEIESEW